MRIFQAFLVLVAAVILWMLPVNEAVRDYRTYTQADNFQATTGVGITSVNVTISKALFDNDISTFFLSSNTSAETPIYSSYNGTSRQLTIGSLAENTTRTLSVSYLVNALTAWPSVEPFVNRISFIILLLIIAFPVAGIAAIFTGRA